LVLTGPLGLVPEYLVAYMTSVLPAALLPTDILLDPAEPDHASAGLKAVSLLRLHKLATIHETDIVRQVGVMSASLWADVETKLRLLLNP
jgi:hypothetical protein